MAASPRGSVAASRRGDDGTKGHAGRELTAECSARLDPTRPLVSPPASSRQQAVRCSSAVQCPRPIPLDRSLPVSLRPTRHAALTQHGPLEQPVGAPKDEHQQRQRAADHEPQAQQLGAERLQVRRARRAVAGERHPPAAPRKGQARQAGVSRCADARTHSLAFNTGASDAPGGWAVASPRLPNRRKRPRTKARARPLVGQGGIGSQVERSARGAAR